MKIGIIACEAFEHNLDYLIRGDKDIVHKEYLEFGLHMRPDESEENCNRKGQQSLRERWTLSFWATVSVVR